MTPVTEASITENLRLAADFQPASYDDWRKLVDGVLKGAPFEKLVGKTADGLKIDPIYPRAQGAAVVAGRPAAAPWQIMQRIDHPDVGAANAQALHDLENGATGLTLVFSGANGAHGFGLEPSAEAVEKVLDGVFVDAGISIDLQVGPQSRMAAIRLAEYVKRKGLDPAACDIRFGLDPIGACAVWGSSPYAWAEIVPAVTGAIKGLAAIGIQGSIRGRRSTADPRCRRIRGPGAGVRAGARIAYLRALEGAGVALEDARAMVYARLSADADQFVTLAKFRALRLLWARIEAGLRPDAQAALRRRRNRLADADAARSLREHAARDDRDVLRRPRRRQTPSPCCRIRWPSDCPIRSRGAWRATRSWCCWKIQPRQGVRSGRRLRRHRIPDASNYAKRRGRCSRKPNGPAESSQPSSRA